MFIQLGGVKIEYNENTPAVVSKEYLEKNINLYFKEQFDEKDLKQNIKNIIKQYINSELTDLITNYIIPDELFWTLILKIYRDLNIILENTVIDFQEYHFNLSDFSHLIIKGGNIIKIIFDNFINKINSQIENKDKILIFLDKIDLYFRKSDIDFGLIINYEDDRLQNDILRALVLKSIDNFKKNVKRQFNIYKTNFLPLFNTLSIDIKEITKEKINSNINSIEELVNKKFLELRNSDLLIKKKNLIDYIQSFIIQDINVNNKTSPSDTILKTYIPVINDADETRTLEDEETKSTGEETKSTGEETKSTSEETKSTSEETKSTGEDTESTSEETKSTGEDTESIEDSDEEYELDIKETIEKDIDLDLYVDEDIKLEEIFSLPQLTVDFINLRNNVKNTNLFWQDNEKLVFFVTKNVRLQGEMSRETKNFLEETISHFSLLRLFFSYDIKHNSKKKLMRPRGELIDLTINLPDDYYGILFYRGIDNHISKYSISLDSISIKPYDMKLKDDEFYSYKLDYIIIELIDMIFGVKGDNIFIISAYKFTKRLNRLFILIIIQLFYHYQCSHIKHFLEYLINKLNSKKPIQFLNEVYGTLPPILNRSKSSHFSDFADIYLKNGESIIDKILEQSFLPLFRIIFQTYSRLIGKDDNLITIDNLLSEQLVLISTKFLILIEEIPNELVLLL